MISRSTVSGIVYEDAAVRRRLAQIRGQIDNPRAVLLEWHATMLRRTAMTFRQLKHGGHYRGVTWRPFAPQYRRKTTGEVVPAWGGLARLRGRGRVLGRLRPSGQRITARSNLLRDTGRMAAAAGLTRRWPNPYTLDMETHTVKYAPRQQAMRPFLFYQLPQDQDDFTKLVLTHIRTVLQSKG
jgi:hypothetical protein